MINIVIPYRPEPHNGLELRYALRSVDKFLTGYKDIFLVGEKFPKWLTNITRITVMEDTIKSAKNILNKLIAAAQIREVENPFLRWDDDIFLTKPLDVKDIKYWHDGNLEQAIKRHHGGYKEIIINTALKLTDSEKFYDTHTPIIMDLKYLRELAGLDWGKFLIKTTYCNRAKVEGEQITDCKIHGAKERCKRKNEIANTLFFSTSQQAIDPEMIEILNELYPKPSKHEI